MSSILNELNTDLYTAMKAKDTFKVSVLRYLLSQIKNKEIELKAQGEELTDELVLKIVKKQIKQRNQSIEGYKQSGNLEMENKEQRELELLENYMAKFERGEE